MSQIKVKPEDIQYTSAGCIVFGVKDLPGNKHIQLVERINNIIKSYESSNSCTSSTTTDGFIEIYFNLNNNHIDREEFSKKISEAINTL